MRERMFRTIVVFGGFAAVIGTIESIFVEKINNMLLPFLLLLVAMGIALVTTFKFRKYNLAATILFFLIIAVMFPCLFFYGGGVHGAAPVWLALGILYAFLMFEGKKVFIYVTLCVLLDGACYLLAYYHPELVTDMVSEKLLHIDSFFAVVVVGMVAGFITKSQMQVFEDEHSQNIEQRKEVERSRDSKNAFFANMSHEIRTPINAIIGLNEMIYRETGQEKIKEYTKDIQLASSLLLGQVNDILDLSQMEMKKMKLVPVSYRTEELFEEVAELTRFRMEKKGLKFFMEIDRTLPSELCGDVRRLKQVLLNLLDNALKYTETGEVVLSVQGEPRGVDEVQLKIAVVDTGVGIRKEDLDHIYDSFNRFDEDKHTRIIGTGLGLAITKQLVDLMDGEITVDSIYTKGSTFTVSVPQIIENRKPLGAVNLKRNRVRTGARYMPCFEAPEARVLVVDDSTMNAKVACSLLAATKVHLDVAYSGKECLEYTKNHYYHVILLDDMMPDMNGLETLAAIRKQENGMCQNSAVIAVTANVMAGAREFYQKQGFDDYAEKPIIGRKLEQVIAKHLPKEIIEYEEKEAGKDNESQIVRASVKKRKKVYITADCTCDLPEELLKQYDIKVLYLYIQTPYGRFMDSKEIDSDSLKQYLTADKSTAYVSNVTVEECEEFFAEALTQAEKVVHISLASRIGRVHQVTKAAAKSFDHVTVIDSGQISCGEGMLVLHAAKLAAEGMDAEEICAELEQMKHHIHTRFLLKGAEVYSQGAGVYQNGGFFQGIRGTICHIFQLHPMVVMKQSRIAPEMLFGGSLESAWRHMVRWHLRHRNKISKEAVFITHVSCSVKQLEFVVEEIKKYVDFERIIIQKASLTNGCSSGLETIGISYYSAEVK